MKQNDEKWLDEILSKHLQKQTGDFDFQQWQEKYPDEAKQLRKVPPPDNKTISWILIWRMIVRSPYTKLGTIAVGLILVSVFLFPSKDIAPASVAWADVQQKIEENNTFAGFGRRVCTYDNDQEKTVTYQIEKYGSIDYGYVEKMFYNDKLIFELYVHRPTRTITLFGHVVKQYFQFQIPERLMNKFDMISIQGVMDFFNSGDVEKIGPKNIQGKEAVGFKKKGNTYFTEELDSKIISLIFPVKDSSICLWVDPKTSLPVFSESEFNVGKGWVTAFHEMHMTEFIDRAEWNIDLDESFFIPEIPDDYQLFGMPEMKATAVIGISGTIAAIPFVVWIRKRGNRKKI